MVKRKSKVAGSLPSNPTVVAIDPGGTTGWAAITIHADALRSTEFNVVDNILSWSQGQIYGDEEKQADEILELIDGWAGCAVVIEDFIARKLLYAREYLAPVRVTAMVSYGMYLRKLPVAFKQSPEMAMTTATNTRLKAWNLYTAEGGLEHARDATRHGITWLRQCKQHEWLRAKCWPHLYG